MAKVATPNFLSGDDLNKAIRFHKNLIGRIMKAYEKQEENLNITTRSILASSKNRATLIYKNNRFKIITVWNQLGDILDRKSYETELEYLHRVGETYTKMVYKNKYLGVENCFNALR